MASPTKSKVAELRKRSRFNDISISNRYKGRFRPCAARLSILQKRKLWEHGSVKSLRESGSVHVVVLKMSGCDLVGVMSEELTKLKAVVLTRWLWLWRRRCYSHLRL